MSELDNEIWNPPDNADVCPLSAEKMALLNQGGKGGYLLNMILRQDHSKEEAERILEKALAWRAKHSPALSDGG